MIRSESEIRVSRRRLSVTDDVLGYVNPFDESVDSEIVIDSCAVCGKPVLRRTCERLDPKYYEGCHLSPTWSITITCDGNHTFISSGKHYR
jgi:hypothetical protein